MCLDIIIRDDDVNFFTASSEVEQAYGEFLESKLGAVNFAIVPSIIPSVTGCVPSEYWSSKINYRFGDNKDIVDYIIGGVKKGFFGVMMHGVTHEYIFKRGIARPEFYHSNLDRMMIRQQCEYLESILGIKINSFVPPGNYLSPKYYKMLSSEFYILFNVPSLIKASRNFSFINVWWWFRRIISVFFKLDLPHRQKKMGVDLSSIDLSPNTDFNKLNSKLEAYLKSGEKILVVLSTHYWEMAGFGSDGIKMSEKFISLARNLKEQGANFLSVQELCQGENLNEKYSNVRIF